MEDKSNIVSRYAVLVWDSENTRKKSYVKSLRGKSLKYADNENDAKTWKYGKCALRCLNEVMAMYSGTLFGNTVLGRVVAIKETENK